MSIVNTILSAQRVRLAVDTAVGAVPGLPFAPDRPAGSMSKLMPLVGINAVLAARGHISVLPMMIFSSAMMVACEGIDFDGLVEALPEIIQGAVNNAAANLRQQGLPAESASDVHVVVAGWSPKLERMRAVSWGRDLGEVELEQVELDDGWPAELTPCLGGVDDDDPPLNDHQMMVAVGRQVAAGLATGTPGFGGRLVLCEVTRHRVTLTDAGPIVTRRAPAAFPAPADRLQAPERVLARLPGAGGAEA